MTTDAPLWLVSGYQFEPESGHLILCRITGATTGGWFVTLVDGNPHAPMLQRGIVDGQSVTVFFATAVHVTGSEAEMTALYRRLRAARRHWQRVDDDLRRRQAANRAWLRETEATFLIGTGDQGAGTGA